MGLVGKYQNKYQRILIMQHSGQKVVTQQQLEESGYC